MRNTKATAKVQVATTAAAAATPCPQSASQAPTTSSVPRGCRRPTSSASHGTCRGGGSIRVD
eukprot:1758277-Pyramimonas_sp.AAC.1